MKFKAILAVSVMLAVAMSGCVSSSKSRIETQTTGQQLIDLKKALDDGVISKSEYERKRQDILHSN